MTKFWNELSNAKKKLTIISGTIALIIGLFHYGWVVYTTIDQYEDTQKKVQALYDYQKKSKEIEKKRYDSLVAAINLHYSECRLYHATVSKVLDTYLDDYTWKGLNLKKDKYDNYYYYFNDLIYPVYYNKTYDNMFYVDDDNKSQWIK